MTVFKEFAPAKINLTLEVLGKRPDGYHELESLVAFAAEAADVVVLDISKPQGCITGGPFGATIAGANLIDVTLAKLAAAEPSLRLGEVLLAKNLPIAAGIGGGSADAAALLRAVRRANPELAGRVDWGGLAHTLGADVPVCLVSRLSFMRGLGERVRPLDTAEAIELPAVLANPLEPVPADKTAQVFRALAAGTLPNDHVSRLGTVTSWDEPGVRTFTQQGRNDLESPAKSIVPEIADVLTELSALRGCQLVRMSGGGPTCFALFATADAAQAAAKDLSLRRPQWWVTSVTLI